MQKRGPKPTTGNVLTMPVNRPVVKPDYLDGIAEEFWDKKIDLCNERGVEVAGCEDQLALYAEVLADIRRIRKIGERPPVALINQARMLGNEFYDTPASQIARAGNQSKKPTHNPFARHGNRPE